ncbi:MAG TPA: hypothetical protein V6D22_06745 [Candidatus Obscuribacterales bacterium]
MLFAKKITWLTLFSASTVLIGFSNLTLPALSETVSAKEKSKPAAEKTEKKEPEKKEAAKAPEPSYEGAAAVNPEELVKHPHEYMNKLVKFTAGFSSFSSLALDYPKEHPMRESKKYLSLLILTPGTPQGAKIPLSEMKLSMAIPKDKDPETDLLAKLKEGDQVEIIGKEFSTALDDPWIDVLRLKKIGGSKDEDKKVASGESDKTDKTDKSDKSKSDEKSGTPGKSE